MPAGSVADARHEKAIVRTFAGEACYRADRPLRGWYRRRGGAWEAISGLAALDVQILDSERLGKTMPPAAEVRGWASAVRRLRPPYGQLAEHGRKLLRNREPRPPRRMLPVRTADGRLGILDCRSGCSADAEAWFIRCSDVVEAMPDIGAISAGTMPQQRGTDAGKEQP